MTRAEERTIARAGAASVAMMTGVFSVVVLLPVIVAARPQVWPYAAAYVVLLFVAAWRVGKLRARAYELDPQWW